MPVSRAYRQQNYRDRGRSDTADAHGMVASQTIAPIRVEVRMRLRSASGRARNPMLPDHRVIKDLSD